jgi:hypothetical protein
MPPLSPDHAFKYRRSYYKFWMPYSGMTREQFDKPFLDSIMMKIIMEPVHNDQGPFKNWNSSEVFDEPYQCSVCYKMDCQTHDKLLNALHYDDPII